MADENSVTQWIHAVRRGDQAYAEKLFLLYFSRLTSFTQSRMRSFSQATYDAEDAAISTFRVLFQNLEEGRYTELDDREEFWHLILKIASRKINRRVEYETAAKRTLDFAIASRIEPENVIDPSAPQIGLESERLLRMLGDVNLEQVAVWKLEGFTNEEIALKLNRTRRTVQRMLNLVRELWQEELDE